VAIDAFGGSAALGILIFAVIAGNARSIAPTLGMSSELDLGADVRGVHSQIAFIIKSFFFTFIGAMLGPPLLPLVFGVFLGGLLLAARAPAVGLALLGSDLSPAERKLVVVALPRGMAAGVLATLPSARGVEGTETLPVVVFAAVLTTILIFAVGFPWVRKSIAKPEPAAEPQMTAPAPPPTS
jgi:cell volume regulation protein A